MIRIVRKSTLEAKNAHIAYLREENKRLCDALAKLRRRFAADILYGATAPENVVDAAAAAWRNVNHD